MTKHKQKLTPIQKVLLVNGGPAHFLRRKGVAVTRPKRRDRD